MSIWHESDLLFLGSAAEEAPGNLLHLQEEMIRAPALLYRRRHPVVGQRVKLDKTHPYVEHMVGCWPLWYQGDSSHFIEDLTGNNHGTEAGTGEEVNHYYTKYGRGLGVGTNSASGRITLGLIDGNNPLSCNVNNEISIFGWCTFAVNPQNSFPRLIDKSNGANAVNGWGLAFRREGATAPDNTINLNIAGTSYDPGLDALGASDAVNDGKTSGFGVTAASGDIDFVWDGHLVGSSTGTYTIPATSTNCAILNWNHTTDRQWGDAPVYYVAVWDVKLPYQWLLDLTYDPYQIFIPA